MATSQATEPPVIVATTAGTILRHARPSFSTQGQLDSITIEVEFDADSGVQLIEVPIHNFGFDDLQALLDIDAVEGFAEPLGLGGALPVDIDAAPGLIMLSLDTTKLGAGRFEQLLTLAASDEDLPGETSTTLELIISVNIESSALSGDIAPPGGDGVVGPADLAALLASWGICPGCPADIAPAGGDGSVGPGDLAQLLAGWG